MNAFNFGYLLQKRAADPMAAVNAKRVADMKAMAGKVRAASGTPNAQGNGTHQWSGRVMPGGAVQGAQYKGPTPAAAAPAAAEELSLGSADGTPFAAKKPLVPNIIPRSQAYRSPAPASPRPVPNIISKSTPYRTPPTASVPPTAPPAAAPRPTRFSPPQAQTPPPATTAPAAPTPQPQSSQAPQPRTQAPMPTSRPAMVSNQAWKPPMSTPQVRPTPPAPAPAPAPSSDQQQPSMFQRAMSYLPGASAWANQNGGGAGPVSAPLSATSTAFNNATGQQDPPHIITTDNGRKFNTQTKTFLDGNTGGFAR